MNKKILFLLFCVAYIFISWAGVKIIIDNTVQASWGKPNLYGYTKLSDDVYRFIDPDADVVCWVSIYGATGGGISCMPLNQTRLRK